MHSHIQHYNTHTELHTFQILHTALTQLIWCECWNDKAVLFDLFFKLATYSQILTHTGHVECTVAVHKCICYERMNKRTKDSRRLCYSAIFFFWHEAQLTAENMLSVIIVVEWIVRHKDVKIHRNGYICHPKWILSCLGASKEPCACVCVWPGPVTSMYDALIHIIIWYTGIISCFCLRFSVHNTVRAQCIWGSYRALDS